MTAAPFASTFVAIALIPVAFLFVHAFLSGKGKRHFHPVTGFAAVVKPAFSGQTVAGYRRRSR